MKLAIISDTHFGDPMCQLAGYGNPAGRTNPKLGPLYEEFRTKVGNKYDYLILLGDIFDFSVCSYRETYEVGKVFFQQIQKEETAKYMVYVPGNHDADIWHLYEHEINVLKRIRDGREPRGFRFSVPAIIDGRAGVADENRISLFKVNKNPADKAFGYGGLFLDNITVTGDNSGSAQGTPLRFAYAYPNVYLVTDQDSILITHGHYFEGYWSILSELVLKIAEDDIGIGEALDLSEMVAINFPLNQLACSGVGQAGPLTRNIVLPLQREVKDGKTDRVKKYLDRLDKEIDLGILDWFDKFLKDWVINKLESGQQTRFNESFLQDKKVRDRFRAFYESSLLEIEEISREMRIDIPAPRSLVFGHTHQPSRWGGRALPRLQTTKGLISFHNSGGWLNHVSKITGKEEFCGAEVFTFDSETQEMKSISIGWSA